MTTSTATILPQINDLIGCMKENNRGLPQRPLADYVKNLTFQVLYEPSDDNASPQQ